MADKKTLRNSESVILDSLSALRKDTYFSPLIKKFGLPNLKRGRNIFEALTRAIVYQQLSGAAAGTIYKRFRLLFPKSKFTPALILALPQKKLRACGLSKQKISYLKDLAKHFTNGAIHQRSLHTMSSDDFVEHLTQVKGIGVWTVHMVLIFTLNRPDILPTGDLGIRKGFQILYELSSLPTHDEMEKRAQPWRGSATAASWYLWRVADEARQTPLPKPR